MNPEISGRRNEASWKFLPPATKKISLTVSNISAVFFMSQPLGTTVKPGCAILRVEAAELETPA